MAQRHRIYKRLHAQKLGATEVKFANFHKVACALLDVSFGGVRLLFKNELSSAALQVGDVLKGQIEGRNIPFRLDFTGRVIWLNRAALVGEPASLVGIAFDGRHEFPENLLRLVEEFGQN